jgi:hypothetical protein
MHAEIANPDALLSRGTQEALAAFAQFRDAVRAASEAKGGRFLESLRGEAIAIFDTSSSAINAALEIQKKIARHLQAKIGINVGEILFTQHGAIGSAADIAEELVRAVPSGGICVSSTALHASPSIQGRTVPVRLELPNGGNIEAFRIEASDAPEAQQSEAAPATKLASEKNTAGAHGASPASSSSSDAPAGAPPPFEIIRRQIFEEIKKTGRRPSADEAWKAFGKYGQDAWDVISRLTEAGILRETNHRRRARHERGHDELVPHIEEAASQKISTRCSEDFAAYKEELSKTAEKLSASIVPSIFSFLGINGLLWYINVTYAQEIPWAAPVTAMWFFGMLRGFARAAQSRRMAREAADIATLDAAQLKEYKAINKERTKFLSRFFSFFSTSSLLLFINLFFSPQSPWFFIPVGFLGVNLLARSIEYRVKMPSRIRCFFHALGRATGRATGASSAAGAHAANTVPLGAYADIYTQAAKDAEACLAAFKNISPDEMPEAEKSVKAGMDQILLLASTLHELDGLIATMPIKELEKDRAAIEVKRQSASPALSAEYDKNIAEIDAQLKAHHALLERKEGLELKLHSLSNQFRQLALDLASAHAADAQAKLDQRHAALEKLSKKAEEIRLTIEDMHTGGDDWLSAEIEKLSRDQVSQDGA